MVAELHRRNKIYQKTQITLLIHIFCLFWHMVWSFWIISNISKKKSLRNNWLGHIIFFWSVVPLAVYILSIIIPIEAEIYIINLKKNIGKISVAKISIEWRLKLTERKKELESDLSESWYIEVKEIWFSDCKKFVTYPLGKSQCKNIIDHLSKYSEKKYFDVRYNYITNVFFFFFYTI